ncbi:Rpp14/Pop5 family-domain-containing protein [Syncephalis plumigaleata]|nr:Rpp14/Pop5 family-domain-containing protein [Syncephalis plumigaleata]
MVRIKHRYILFEILYAPPQDSAKPLSALSPSPDRLSTREILDHIQQTIETNFGDYGTGMVNRRLQVKYFNPLTGLGIIRAPRDHFQMVWAALTLTQNIRRKLCVIRVLHIGGTIRSVQTHAIRHDRDQLLRLAEQQSIDKDEVAALTVTAETTIAALQY